MLFLISSFLFCLSSFVSLFLACIKGWLLSSIDVESIFKNWSGFFSYSIWNSEKFRGFLQKGALFFVIAAAGCDEEDEEDEEDDEASWGWTGSAGRVSCSSSHLLSFVVKSNQ